MCELTRSFAAHDMLTVVPQVEALPPVRLGRGAQGFGDGRQRSMAVGGEDDVLPRGYRYGDDLRRVHWRSTARYGELMVRREEQPHRARCTVLLDTRREAFRGAGPGSAFEWSVSGAASVLTHMLQRGYSVRLLTDTGTLVPGEAGASFGGAGVETAEAAGLLMDTLSVIGHSDGEGLTAAQEVLRRGGEGLLVAFLGALDEEQARTVARMRHRTGGALAFLPEDDEEDAEPDFPVDAGAVAAAPDTERVLREAGWTVVRAPRGASMAAVWRQADQQRTGLVDGGERR